MRVIRQHDVDRPAFDTKMRHWRGGFGCSHCGLGKHGLVSIPKVAGKGDLERDCRILLFSRNAKVA